MQPPPVYSFLSPTLLEHIKETYNREEDEDQVNRTFIPGTAEIQTCMVGAVTGAEDFRPARGRSVIQIWDASNPDNPTHLNRPLSESALTNYRRLEATDRYFRDVHKQPPVNDGRELIRSFLGHPQAYNNAFWNPGTKSIYYGEVDPRIFTPFAGNQEITTHEFGHAVTHLSSSLRYKGQSGALNESASDVFAMIQKHQQNNTQHPASPDASFLIGEGVVVNESGPNLPLRSMSAPGTAYTGHPYLGDDDQRAHMNNYHHTDEDYGGVHANAGIPNKGFEIAAKKYGQPLWEKIGNVWYNTVVDSEPNDEFEQFAQRSIRKADGMDRNLGEAVRKGWWDVGVDLRLTGFKRPEPEE